MSGQLPLPQHIALTKNKSICLADSQLDDQSDESSSTADLLDINSYKENAIKQLSELNQSKQQVENQLTRYHKTYGPLTALSFEAFMESSSNGLFSTNTWTNSSVFLKLDGSLIIKKNDVDDIVIEKQTYSASFPKKNRENRPGCFRINLRGHSSGVKKIVLDIGSVELAQKWIDLLNNSIQDFFVYEWVTKKEDWSYKCPEDDTILLHYIAFVYIYMGIIEQIEVNKSILQNISTM